MSADYSGLTRNNWTGTWSPTGAFPIVLDTEIRGGLQSISGGSGDKLTDITGQRLVDGMLVYLKAGYTVGNVTRSSNSYFTYTLLSGEIRDPNTGAVPNAEANWTASQIGSSVTVDTTITDSSTNAVSGNAVFDALALKAPLASPSFTGAVVCSTTTAATDAIYAYSETGSGVVAGSSSSTALYAESESGMGINASTVSGTYHALFGDTGINQSFVARVKGAFGWIRGSFTGRIHPPDTITADRTYTLPDGSGNVLVYTNTQESGKVLTATNVNGVATWENAATGTGSVSTVSVVTANGVSGTVTNPANTPAITLSLGNITPSKVNGLTITAGTGTLTLSSHTLTVAGAASVIGTNTGDQTAASLGLGNVTNESKATMFANPTFTGTVNGITSASVGLGNVTDESKATMFTSPTFTGEAVINTAGDNKKSLVINSTSVGVIQEAYGLVINKSGVVSIGLQVNGTNILSGIVSTVSGPETIGIESTATGVEAKAMSLNASGDDCVGLKVIATDEFAKGIDINAYGDEAIGAAITTTTGDYHAKFGDTGINQSFVARLKGAFGWIRGSFTGRIHPLDTLTANRTYTLPDATGTVPVYTVAPTTGQVLTSSGTNGESTWVTSTTANTANTLVKRDSLGGGLFSRVGINDPDDGGSSYITVSDLAYSLGNYIELNPIGRTLEFLSNSGGAATNVYTFPNTSGSVPVYNAAPTVTGQVLTSSGTDGAATWSGLLYTGTGNTGVLSTGSGQIAINSLPHQSGGTKSSNISIGINPFISTSNANPANNVQGNIGIGDNALDALNSTSEYSSNNIAIGTGALASLNNCQASVFIGTYAGTNLTADSSSSTIIGDAAGVYYGGSGDPPLTQAAGCTFLGRLTRGSAAVSDNQIVIGKGAIGDQNNSTVIGNTDTTQTRLAGNTLKLGSAALNTSIAQTAAGSSKTITLPNENGTVPVYTNAAAAGKVLTSTGTTGAATWQDAATGTGSVSSVSVTSSNGITSSVATNTTTPAITLSLGDITPSKVNGLTITSGTGTLSVNGTASVSGTNTGDQTNITGNAATVTTNAVLTGHVVTSSGNATVLGSFTLAQLNTAVSDADVASAASVALKISSDTSGVSATAITNIIQVTQSVYNSLSPNGTTLYVIVG